jgi:hypothetical protein
VKKNDDFQKVIDMYKRKTEEIIRNNKTLDEFVKTDKKGQIRKIIENDPVIIKTLEENPELAEQLVQHIQTDQIQQFKNPVHIEKLKKTLKDDLEIAKYEIEDVIKKHSKNQITKIWMQGDKFNKMKNNNPRKCIELIKQYEVLFKKTKKLIDKDPTLKKLLEIESIQKTIQKKPEKVYEQLHTRYIINKEQKRMQTESEEDIIEELKNNQEIRQNNPIIKKALEQNDTNTAIKEYMNVQNNKKQLVQQLVQQDKLSEEIIKELDNTHTNEGIQEIVTNEAIKQLKESNPNLFSNNTEFEKQLKQTPPMYTEQLINQEIQRQAQEEKIKQLTPEKQDEFKQLQEMLGEKRKEKRKEEEDIIKKLQSIIQKDNPNKSHQQATARNTLEDDIENN